MCMRSQRVAGGQARRAGWGAIGWMTSAQQPSIEISRLKRKVKAELETWSVVATMRAGQAPAAHHLRMIAMLEEVERGKIR